jgi:tRNA(fMet)-specific endonuclease VapC
MNCLDSSFLIDYLNGLSSIEAYLRDHENESFFAPTPSIYEVAYGEGRLTGTPVEQSATKLAWCNPLPFDYQSAIAAARIRRELEDRGEMLDNGDILIGATVLTNGGTIVTGDDHFERIDGLDVEYY